MPRKVEKSSNHEEKHGNKRIRANGEGSFRIRGNSVQFRWDGKSTTELINSRSRTQLKGRLSELCTMPIKYNPRLTVGGWARQWYNSQAERVKEKTLEESTYAGYEYTVKIIEEEFKNDVLTEISAEEINKRIPKIMNVQAIKDKNGKLVEVTKPYSFQIYKKIKCMMGQMYRSAAAAKKIKPADNPMLLVERLVNNERAHTLQYDAPATIKRENYTLDEVAQLIKELPNNKYGHAIIVDIGCGFRGQEIRPLRTWDIEPDGSVINISKAVKRGLNGKEYLGITKTPTSDRLTPVPGFAQASARWLREHAINDYVMPNRTGTHVTYRSYLDGYNDAVKKTTIAPLTPHKMRDTYTTTLRYKVKEDEGIIMANTGHTDRETMEGYAHVSLEEKQAAAKKFDILVQNILNGQ